MKRFLAYFAAALIALIAVIASAQTKPPLRLVQTIYTQLHELPVAGRDGATPEQVSAAWNDIMLQLVPLTCLLLFTSPAPDDQPALPR